MNDNSTKHISFLTISSEKLFLKFSICLADILLINILYFWFVKSLLFQDFGLSSITNVAISLLGFLFALYIFSKKSGWGAHRYFLLQATLILTIAALVRIIARTRNFDWIPQEMIKLTSWISMFSKASPFYAVIFPIVLLFLLITSLVRPKNFLLRSLPVLFSAYSIWKIIYSFLVIDEDPFAYVIIFCAPILIFSILIFFQRFQAAFRFSPLIFIMSLIELHYFGVLPLAPYDVASLSSQPGVKLLYPTPEKTTDSSFLFLRKIISKENQLIFNYGPTCGIYSIPMPGGSYIEQKKLPGLIRDMKLSPDGQYLWTLNWQNNFFYVMDPKTLEPVCTFDLLKLGIVYPFQFIFNKEFVYLTSTTIPNVFELSIVAKPNLCQIKINRILNFQSREKGPFLGGTHGIYIDNSKNRIYVMLVSKNENSKSNSLDDVMHFNEVELDSFKTINTTHIPFSSFMFTADGTDSFLLPSYFESEISEISSKDLTLKRIIHADPSTFSIVFDKTRNLIYSTSRITGSLLVIDYNSGNILKRLYVGPKADPMILDRQSDRLIIGSGFGIVQIDLAAFLSSNNINR